MTVKPFRVFIGFDPREAEAFAVARDSIRKFDRHIMVHGLVLDDLREQGLYTRPTERRLGKLWDVISGAYMATEFAVSRFLVPEIVRREKWYGWALFMDCDMMVRHSLNGLRALLDDDKAVMCVKHDHRPMFNVKMDGQEQTSYPRKNWSSVLAFNCDHYANQTLSADFVNSKRGLDLHQLCWLTDDEIGELPPTWNYLVGHTEGVPDPSIVHWTDGIPTLSAFKDAEYADEFFATLNKWAA
jgi:hypothetical protein